MSARESIIPVFVPHLGCPRKCVFCNQNRISGALKPADAGTVREAVEKAEAASPKNGRRQLAFYGGSFTAIPGASQEELLSAASDYLQKGYIDEIRLSTRPDAISPEVMERLKRYSVRTVELGAQSMDDEVLALAERGHTAADVENASSMLKESGFKLILQMMTGLPGDTREKTVYTAKKIASLDPDGVRIYPTVIVKDTPLYDMWKRGEYKEHSIEEAVEYCAAILPVFEKAGIPVIRLGLNPTDDLSGGDAVGGAYHPALGEMVRSRLIYEKISKLINESIDAESLTVGVNPRSFSQAVGQKRCNIEKAKQDFGVELKVVPDENIPVGEVELE